MVDFVAGFIVAGLIALAMLYIIKEKKQGTKCIGCPNARSCTKYH